MRYYIAYGSNLNKDQMAWRCPTAKPVGTSVIKGYGLLFKGSKSGAYLTIEKDKNREVPVAIWEVTDEDEKALDRYEGCPNFYYKKNMILNIQCEDGSQMRKKCFVYIMHESRPTGIPTSLYTNVCLQGYIDFGFDVQHLVDAFEESKARRWRIITGGV